MNHLFSPLQRLGPTDAEELTELYLQVEINSENYREKLSPGPASFAERGGMFVINDLATNKRILSSDHDFVFGSFIEGHLVGMIWYDLNDHGYPIGDITYASGFESYRDLLRREQEAKTLLTGKEVIALPEAHGGLAYLLFENFLSATRSAGNRYMIGEVYHVDGYEDAEGYHPADLLNHPSSRVLERTGGIRIGIARQKIIDKGAYKAYITPQVVLWEMNSAVETVQNLIKIKSEGDKNL